MGARKKGPLYYAKVRQVLGEEAGEQSALHPMPASTSNPAMHTLMRLVADGRRNGAYRRLGWDALFAEGPAGTLPVGQRGCAVWEILYFHRKTNFILAHTRNNVHNFIVKLTQIKQIYAKTKIARRGIGPWERGSWCCR